MSQPLWHSIPYLCILLPLGSAAVTSVLKPRWARYWTMFALLVVTSLSGVISAIFASGAESYTYMMGHFPAPWGNEIRAGQLEAVTALFFSLIMLLSLLGGLKKIDEHIDQNKVSLYYVVLLLLTAALMAQVYTNDIFTAYVFLEIMTLAACALIAIRKRGRTLVAATRYMIMNLIGSGLFLLGIILLYDLTGHLLMSNMKEAVAALAKSGQYQVPLTVVVALISIGLPVPHMGAGCLRLFYPDVRCGAVLSGQQGLHLPADEDYVPRNWAGRHCLHWDSGCAVRFRACRHGDGQHFRHSSDRHSPDDCVLLRRADWLCLHGHRSWYG